MRETVAKLLTFWMPIKEKRRQLREKIKNKLNDTFIWNLAQIHYNYLAKKIKKNSKKRKIRVLFTVVFDSVFPSEPIFKKMLNSDFFEPQILVIPDVIRGKKNTFYQMNKTYETLLNRYKEYNNVFKAYDENSKKYVDYRNKTDIVFFSNPYDNMTHLYYGIEYLSKKCLPCYVNYFYFGKLQQEFDVIKSDSFKSMWRIFIESNNVKEIFNKNNVLNKENCYVTGYVKMDSFDETITREDGKKIVIIAPHHSLPKTNCSISISNFLMYYEFFLKLPYMYPDIHFIFRPHPLLFVKLAKKEFWGEKRVKEYLNKIESIPNMEYQEGGDYFKTFAESTAMIHDCGSFLAEYFYTGHPQCYILDDKKDLSVNFIPEGIHMLDYTYKAFNEQDIISFIDNVVIKQNDSMKESRIKWANENIIINHHTAADNAIEIIKNSILK